MVKISKSKLGTIAYRTLLAVMIPVICSAGYFYAPQIYDLSNSLYTGTLAVLHGGTGTTTSTGTGNVVLSNTPTLTTPVLGAATGTSVSLTAASTINANGTSLPSPQSGTLLQLGNANGFGARIELDSFGAGEPIINGKMAEGTNASKTAVTNGDDLLFLQAFGYGSTGYSASYRAYIALDAAQTWTDSNQGTKIVFGTTALNAAIAGTNMTLDGSGNLTTVGTINTTAVTMAGNTAPVCSSTAPTVTGFGSSPSVPNNNGTCAFTVNVGTGGSASTGTVNLPSSTTGWVCTAQDVTTPASFITAQTGGTTNTATFTNYSRTTGLAIAWTASDVLRMECHGY